jgi:N-formylglutamate amidohydrolase
VCLGTDPFHTPPELTAAARAAFGDVALDTPFAGCYIPAEFHGRDPRVNALMLEFRRDGYMHEPGGPPTGGLDRLAAALATVVNSVSSAA